MNDENDDARVREIVARVAPTRGRLQYSLYDRQRQQYVAVRRRGAHFRVTTLEEFERLAALIAATVDAHTWKDDEPGSTR